MKDMVHLRAFVPNTSSGQIGLFAMILNVFPNMFRSGLDENVLERLTHLGAYPPVDELSRND